MGLGVCSDHQAVLLCMQVMEHGHRLTRDCGVSLKIFRSHLDVMLSTLL